jgi:hypothetical protein
MLPANSTYETDALMPFLSHIGGVSIVTFANRAALRHVDRHSAHAAILARLDGFGAP